MQEVDPGSPVACVAPYGVVLAAGASGVEHFPPGEVAVEGVLTMRLLLHHGKHHHHGKHPLELH